MTRAEIFLYSYRDSLQRLEQLRIKQRNLYESALDTPGVEIAIVDGESQIIPRARGGSGRANRVESIAIELAEIDEAIKREQMECTRQLLIVTDLIDSLDIPEVYKSEIYHHYIDGLNWEDTAEAVGYSDRAIYITHRPKMLEAVEERLEEVVADVSHI